MSPLLQKKNRNGDPQAVEAARLRFRPIVMTSMAFVLGVATWARSGCPPFLGTGAFGGMLLATFVATIFIPLFFTWLTRKHADKPAENVQQETA
ncbi:hydrophobic/amphiphilic exporter-1, HAE1 family/multidrug efflux pump [Nitrosospira sp. Nl5]|uniref:efflux RND transporter permease subunit n=1 Tax=Nitrosospira sp. Nl5 TaxID=200120 RepID=UPI0008868686|nr:efflux RND transporter permease subunit [Nitrosospira sp. Nl5]SCY47785.1 hydrophobic/amphiphilic exporter-1, HAE1 family/multidrug efflux pump [Nitrosospira sp. Nl5]